MRPAIDQFANVLGEPLDDEFFQLETGMVSADRQSQRGKMGVGHGSMAHGNESAEDSETVNRQNIKLSPTTARASKVLIIVFTIGMERIVGIEKQIGQSERDGIPPERAATALG